MDIAVTTCKPQERKALFKNILEVPFGSIFTDHFFIMTYQKGSGWHSARIEPLRDICLHPGALVFHYGQEIFEGLKAFHRDDGKIILFRPEKNVARFNRSARRMCMPEVDNEFFMEAMLQLVTLERRWIPKQRGSSLYIRPTMIATEVGLGVRSATDYLFYILLAPVGPYYKEGFKPIGLYVTTEYIRAAVGGVGEAKTGGNYAASLLAGEEAHKAGYSQVLWLDAVNHEYVEEVGAMNIFFAFGKTLVTAPLNGSILHGVTRESVIELARHLGYTVREDRLSIHDLTAGIEKGTLTEIFGTGTAASISPVGKISFKGKEYSIGNGGVGPISQKLYDYLLDLQYGRRADTFNWLTVID